MKRKNMFWLTTAVLGLFLAACGTEARGASQLIIAMDGEPVILDPHRSNDARSSPVINQIFERLVEQDEYGNLHPSLALAWRQIDELTYEFDIRQGVYFHNGDPLQVSDVVFSLQRAATSPTSATFLGMLNPEAIYAVDEQTIRVGTDFPFVALIAQLAHTAGNIVSEAAVLELGEDFGNQPVGTGALMLDRWVHGEQVELIRFDEYYGPAPAFERLIFRNIPEAASRLIELETGQVHIALNIAPTDVQAVANHPDLNMLREESLRSHYIGFNVNQAPFDDVRVRQAINHAVDVDLIIETILEGVGVRATGPLSSQVWGAHPNLPAYGFDLERARQLLAEAGLAEGFETSILTDLDNNNRNIAEALRNMLQQIGIAATVESVEWPIFLETANAGNHEIFITGWTVGTMDADYGLFPLFHTSSHGSGGNRTFYSNPEVDRLLEAARQETNPERRQQLYFEAQEIIVADAPWVFMNIGEILMGTQNNVRGLANLSGRTRFADVYFE